jgi:methionyl-tRNA formyltransferase
MQHKILIPPNSTAEDLHNIMMHEASEFAIETCNKLIMGKYILEPQTIKSNKLAPKIYKNTAEIN